MNLAKSCPLIAGVTPRQLTRLHGELPEPAERHASATALPWALRKLCVLIRMAEERTRRYWGLIELAKSRGGSITAKAQAQFNELLLSCGRLRQLFVTGLSVWDPMRFKLRDLRRKGRAIILITKGWRVDIRSHAIGHEKYQWMKEGMVPVAQ